MRDIKTILDDYRKGTPDVRLNLFLFHRELRCTFNTIEKNENAIRNRKRIELNFFKKHKKRMPFSFGPLINWR
jgi:hypothetical protein